MLKQFLREPVSVSFTNLKNGFAVRSPFWVEFGIRGMGVVPAGTAHAKAGHHHLLVDKQLQINYRDKIPFDDSHRHFGKGQTGTALDLAPGKHTLRLLFADHEHRPLFVYSREITVTVLGRATVRHRRSMSATSTPHAPPGTRTTSPRRAQPPKRYTRRAFAMASRCKVRCA